MTLATTYNRSQDGNAVRSILVVAFNKSIADEVNVKLRSPRKLPPPTPEGKAFVAAVKRRARSITLSALAGTGKTTSIEQAVQAYPDAKITCRTVHGCGFSALQYHFGRIGVARPEVSEHKVGDILDEMLDIQNLPDGGTKDRALLKKGIALQLVSLMKAHAFGAVRDDATNEDLMELVDHYSIDLAGECEEEVSPEEVFDLARAALDRSNRNVAVIDFDDMVYLPLLLKCSFYQNDLIFVDECQDLNPARIHLIKRMANGRAQVVFVGDRNQAIYGFTGADVKSFATIGEMFGTEELPLSVCWRCAKNVIAEAQKIVPSIQAAPGAVEGSVNHIDGWDNMMESVQAGDFILCRTTAPLVSACMMAIRSGKAATVRGRDIGRGLLNEVDRLAKKRSIRKAGSLIEKLSAYRTEVTDRLPGPKNEKKLLAAQDRIDTLIVLAEDARDWAALRDKINTIFSDSEGSKDVILCSTAHKAKGLESKNVYIICPELMPFPFARKDWEQEQERNLKYVAITRARENLYWVRDDKRSPLNRREED